MKKRVLDVCCWCGRGSFGGFTFRKIRKATHENIRKGKVEVRGFACGDCPEPNAFASMR